MILYDYWRSSSAWRVRIALHFKGIAFERRVVNLIKDGGEQHTDAFRTLNPLGQVPVLVTPEKDGARTITQSMAIIGYLEDTVPTPPLLPADPWLRARARQLAELVNAGIQPFQNLPTMARVSELGGDAKEFVRGYIARGLDALEASAEATAGTFLVADAPSFADVCLVPQLNAARRFGLEVARWPLLARVEEACMRLQPFVAAHADRQPDAEGAKK